LLDLKTPAQAPGLTSSSSNHLPSLPARIAGQLIRQVSWLLANFWQSHLPRLLK